MKRFIHRLIVGLTLVILVGCGPAPAPTLSVADIQGTGFALASTSIAVTKAALPTATLPPPTSTPQPLATPFPTVLSQIPTPSLIGGPTQNPCNLPPPSKPKGLQVKVKFKNATGGSIILSFGMNAPNALGECGTYGFSLSAFGEPTEQVLVGCYWGYGWVSAKKSSTSRSIDNMCLSDGSHIYEVTIGTEVMGLSG